MPIVLKRHGSHHYYRQFLRDLPAEQFARDSSPTVVDHLPLGADVQLHSTYVLGTGLFLVLLVGYLFRRQIRSVPSRLAHAISVHGTPLIHIHLHTLHYSPLNDHDTTTADLESPVSPVHEDEDEPAPPYSAPLEQRTLKEKTRYTKPLHITVPPRPTFTRPTTEQLGKNSSSHGAPSSSYSSSSSSTTCETPSPSTPSLFSDAGSSSAASSPVPCSLSTPVSTQQSTLIDANGSSKASALDLASPRASRWDAYPRSYGGYMTGPQNNHNDVHPRDVRASILSNRSDILTTDSPCATPPPQYTITILSSPRSRKNSENEGPPVPDIILSPVPWLPREYVPPPSPPCYLSVPSRKSKSRGQSSSTRSGASEKEKPLPPSPQQQQQQQQQQKQQLVQNKQSTKFISDVEIKQRHASLNDPSAKPTTSISRPALPLGFNAPRRSATLPVQQRIIPPPAPQPILPIDLEAVYPTSPTKGTFSESEKDSEEDTPWLWRSRSSPAPSKDKDRRMQATGDSKSGTEKAQYKEKECSSDSDDNIPLAQGLVLAMARRRQERLGPKPMVTSPVSQVFKKKFLGRLSALAAKARSAIEHEFDSSDEDEDHRGPSSSRGAREQPIVHEKAALAHNNFIQRELRAVDTFIIGDEE